MFPFHNNMMKAEHLMRYRILTCLVTKLRLLADSFQVRLRLISDLIHIKHVSGKARLPFQTKPYCYTEASHHSRQYNTAQETSPFSKGFLFSLFTSSVYAEVPFPLLPPCTPNSSPPIPAPIQNRWFSFLSRRLSEKLRLPQSPKLCCSESKWLRWKLYFL